MKKGHCTLTKQFGGEEVWTVFRSTYTFVASPLATAVDHQLEFSPVKVFDIATRFAVLLPPPSIKLIVAVMFLAQPKPLPPPYMLDICTVIRHLTVKYAVSTQTTVTIDVTKPPSCLCCCC
jgi:hypothetical protein